jgi:hypothetical protein
VRCDDTNSQMEDQNRHRRPTSWFAVLALAIGAFGQGS